MFPGADTFYKFMYLVGFALMMVINVKTYKKYRLKTEKVIPLTLITYVAGVVGAMIMADIQTAINRTVSSYSGSNVAIFGAVVFTPLFMTIVSLIYKQDWRRVIDMLAPGIFVILLCAKFGCFCAGCCHGIECSFGVMSPKINTTVFPIQIIEVFFMLLIVAFCFWYAFKSKHYIKGAVYPITTILYCFMRFFVEFFRYYETPELRNILFGMTFWQLCCICVSILCIIWLLVICSPKVKDIDKLQVEQEFQEDKLLEMQRQQQKQVQKKKRK